MFIDSKGKLFGKINIIDMLIVLVILSAVGFVGYKFTKSKAVTPFTKPDEIVLSFLAEEVQQDAAKVVKVGDDVEDFQRGIYIGKVKDVKVDKSIVFYPNDKGEVVQSTKPGYSSIVLTIEASGVLKENGVPKFSTADFYMQYSYQLKVGMITCWGRITDIKKKG